jgi:hypothetical protein
VRPPRDPQQLHLFRNLTFITTGDAAAMLNVSLGTVCKYAQQGLLQSYRRHPKAWYMISQESCQELLEQWADQALSSGPVDADR